MAVIDVDPMQVLVTGKHGMLGADLLTVLEKEGVQVVGTDKAELNIIDGSSVDHFFDFIKPTHVINCAAYTDVDEAETSRRICRQINVEGVQNLITASKKHSSRLIQISTDYVFSGEQESYSELDETAPINYYGQTKLEAEKLIKEQLTNYAIVRTSWLYGKNGKNFVKTILNAAQEKSDLRVVSDQTGSPTYTRDLSEALCGLLEGGGGLYHLTNSGSCSWYDLAREVVGIAGISCDIKPCSSDEYIRSARRPKHSVLENTKLPVLRHWREALSDYIKHQ